MNPRNLVKMANDIGRFFASEPQRTDAVAGIANHLRRSWDPRMLRQIAAYVRAGGAGLDELPHEAVQSLNIPETPATVPSGEPVPGARTSSAG
ncbi:MAG TPA: formate dehydrogenase subunit delta [Steroidobacteraceae bacterium]|nr:formate dehydrogenase subunit delta [Steroidobacteraceae bacterium]